MDLSDTLLTLTGAIFVASLVFVVTFEYCRHPSTLIRKSSRKFRRQMSDDELYKNLMIWEVEMEREWEEHQGS